MARDMASLSDRQFERIGNHAYGPSALGPGRATNEQKFLLLFPKRSSFFCSFLKKGTKHFCLI
jgi:hypothetical protein